MRAFAPSPLLVMVAACFALVAAPVRAQPAKADAAGVVAPAPAPEPEPERCASRAAPGDVRSAFAYDLESPAVLRFLTAVAAVPEADREAAYRAVASAAASPMEADARRAVTATCRTADELYGYYRVSYLVGERWPQWVVRDPELAAAFSLAADTAIRALGHGDALAPEARRAALVPFASIPAFATVASAPPAPPARCAEPDRESRVVREAIPIFPRESASGSAVVGVSLSDTGAVRSARLVGRIVAGGAASDAYARAALLAVAATVYAPALDRCIPVGSLRTDTWEYSVR